MSRILIIEDDPTISDIMNRILTGEGHTCRVAANGTQGLQEIAKEEPDIITLDVMLGEDETGLDYCRKIRQEYSQRIVIIMVTAKGGNYDQAIGFNNGCDHYIEKPFDPELLKIKVRSAERRVKQIRHEAIDGLSKEEEKIPKKIKLGDSSKEIVTKHLRLDLERNKVYAGEIFPSHPEKGTDLDVTLQEMRVLAFLIKSQKTVSRKEILSGAWATNHIDYRVVDKQVSAIRGKIEKVYGESVKLIVTERGEGYRFIDEVISYS